MDIKKIRSDFPILERDVNGKKLVYLDNAATSHKPAVVISKTNDFYFKYNANVHRGLHTLSEEATDLYEKARKTVATFINAYDSTEVIFTSGTTSALNFIADSLSRYCLKQGDEILLTEAEHHSNMVPWQEAAKRFGAELKFIETDLEGKINVDQLERFFTDKTKIVAIFQASNVLGTILPVKEISKTAKKYNAYVVIDGAQAIPHLPVNVQSLGCDFYAFSGHKMLGPTGIGVLWGRKEILNNLEPSHFGGGMIDEVSLNTSTWAALPEKFEAGTPNISGAIGLATAIDYLNEVGMENIRNHEKDLLTYAIDKLSQIDGLKIVGNMDVESRTGLVAFYLPSMHAHDVAAVLSAQGVAVRSGHHCTMPLHRKLNIPATTRASFYLYNDYSDVDALVEAIYKAKQILE